MSSFVCAQTTFRRDRATFEAFGEVVKLVGDGVEYQLPAGFSERLYNKIRNT